MLIYCGISNNKLFIQNITHRSDKRNIAPLSRAILRNMYIFSNRQIYILMYIAETLYPQTHEFYIYQNTRKKIISIRIKILHPPELGKKSALFFPG